MATERKTQSIVSKLILTGGIAVVFLYAYGQMYTQPEPVMKTTEIKTQMAVFFTEAIAADKSHTHIDFDYRFDTPNQEAWVSVQTKPGAKPLVILMDHPVFANLGWSHVANEQFTLFQKTAKFKTVQEFLDNPPKDAKIVADPTIVYQSKVFEPTAGVTPLETGTNIEGFDYLLTTYHVPVPRNDFLRFQAVFNANEAELNEKNALLWKLDLPRISETNKLVIGEIHIDFRQAEVR